MTKLITKNFKTHAARQFVESFSEAANTIYYMVAHKSTPFTDDNSPPDPSSADAETSFNLYDEILFGKHVGADDIKHMVRNVTWTSGTVYEMYDDLVTDMGSKNFYVVSDEGANYYVFKCLNNNGGAASTDKPLFSETSADDEIYQTNDGYQWKYMYTISNANYEKFATSEYIPVIEDANVSGNAVSGSLESIVLSSGGKDYNSFTSGTIKETAVNGNTLIHALDGDEFTDYLVTVDDVTGFVEERATSLNTFGKTAAGIIISIYSANNTLRLTNTTRRFTATSTLTGSSSNTSATIQSAERLTSELSANTGFYNNNTFYIRSGRGAGQLKTITSYTVVGEERRVLLDSAFATAPDDTSIFEIGPRVIITGDGQGAGAVAVVNPATSAVEEIEIITSGSGYTYADITVVANTGLIDTTTGLVTITSSAQARPIISPPGGHGSNVINELVANRVGISTSFANNESGEIPDSNDFRKVSLLKDPLFANVELTIDTSTATNYTPGEVILQANSGATGTISDRDGDVIRVTNVRGFFVTGNTTVNYITGQTSAETNAVTAVDKTTTLFDQRQIYQVEMTYTGPSNSGFELDELVSQEGIQEIPTGFVRLTVADSVFDFVDGETITQANTGATGIVSARYGSVIEMSDITGTFLSGNSDTNYITGGTSAANTSVSSVTDTALANATGYVHYLNNGINSTVIGITNVKGFFSLSDDASGTVNSFTGATSKSTAKLTGRTYDKNYLVDNSGEFLYVENFVPITRSSSQTETVKLIIEF